MIPSRAIPYDFILPGLNLYIHQIYMYMVVSYYYVLYCSYRSYVIPSGQSINGHVTEKLQMSQK